MSLKSIELLSALSTYQHMVSPPVCQQATTSITCQHVSPPVHQWVLTLTTNPHTKSPACQWAMTPITNHHMSPPACQQVTTLITNQQVSPPACQWVMTLPTSQQLTRDHQAQHTLTGFFIPRLHSHEGEHIVESLGCQYLVSLLTAGKGLCQVFQISFLCLFLLFCQLFLQLNGLRLSILQGRCKSLQLGIIGDLNFIG